MTGATKPWVSACHAAIDFAAEGKDPAEAVGHLPPDEAERAMSSALPIIQKVAWISDAILAEPSRGRRKLLLEAHTKQNSGIRQAVETRVRRLWQSRS